MKNIIGCVLAGGKSSRMGEDKALMLFRGQKMVDHMSNIFTDSGLDEVIVSGKDCYDNTIEDLVEGLGPVGGVISVILSKKTSGIIFVATDMPLLQTEVVKELLSHNFKSHAICFENHPLPFFLKISPKVIDLAKLILSKKKSISVKDFLSQVGAQYIYLKAEQEKYFCNVNNKQQWNSLIKEEI